MLKNRIIFLSLSIMAFWIIYSFPILPAIGQSEDVYIRYSSSGELYFCDIKIEQSKLRYTYFEDVEDRCKYHMAQAPCWKKEELKTVFTDLNPEETADIIAIIKSKGFSELKPNYRAKGLSSRSRCYGKTITVRTAGIEKEIKYCGVGVDDKDIPVPFQELKNRLFKLVKNKFLRDPIE